MSITDGPKGPIDSEWSARSSQLTLELTELRSFETALQPRHRRGVDQAAEHLSLLWLAFLSRLQASKQLRVEETMALFGALTDLNTATASRSTATRRFFVD